jgi:ubiquinone/menaquinone biosynthesis C-methylase UbiE
MPDIEANERWWTEHSWRGQGDAWSRRWGGSDYQWFGMLYPRVREFLPAGTILEIATGHGRWTQYLVPLCERLIGIDLVLGCVDACRKRFADQPHASFHKNDGRSLEMVPDGEVDLAFSFDSLVHCESDVVESYVHELSRKLSSQGVAFLHHSNLGAYLDPETGQLPFRKGGWRGESMSAPLFDRFCREAGLRCIGQELVRWREKEHWFRDCFSMLTRPDSRFARENQVLENTDYWAQAEAMLAVAKHYGPGGFPRVSDGAPGPPYESAPR